MAPAQVRLHWIIEVWGRNACGTRIPMGRVQTDGLPGTGRMTIPVASFSTIDKQDPGELVFRRVRFLSLFFFIPFTLVEFFNGRVFTGAVETGLVLLILTDCVCTRFLHAPVLPRTIFLTLVSLISLYFIHDRGMIGIYWAYPLVICMHLAMERRTALALNAVYFAGVISLAWAAAGPGETARIFATLFLTSTFAYLFSTTVREQRHLLQEQIVTDSLTGAYNRRHLDKRLAETIEQKRRYGHAASMIIFDVDHFKKINDRYGHQAGDRALRILIDTVKTRIRVVDQVFRYGGEEFVALLPDTKLPQAEKLAIDVNQIIAQLNMIEAGPVTISCGVAELDKGEDAFSWIRRCDRALYNAKHQGRNRVCTTEEQILEENAVYSVLGS